MFGWTHGIKLDIMLPWRDTWSTLQHSLLRRNITIKCVEIINRGSNNNSKLIALKLLTTNQQIKLLKMPLLYLEIVRTLHVATSHDQKFDANTLNQYILQNCWAWSCGQLFDWWMWLQSIMIMFGEVHMKLRFSVVPWSGTQIYCEVTCCGETLWRDAWTAHSYTHGSTVLVTKT